MLRNEDQTMYNIPVEQISYARCQKNDFNGKLAGLLIGGAIDLTLTLLIWNALAHGNLPVP